MSETDKIPRTISSIVSEYRRLDRHNPGHELLEYFHAVEYIRMTAEQFNTNDLYIGDIKEVMFRDKVIRFLRKYGESKFFDATKVLTSYLTELKATNDKIEGLKDQVKK